MPFPEALRTQIDSYFQTRDLEVLPPMELPDPNPGESQYVNFLATCNSIMETFTDLTRTTPLELYKKLYTVAELKNHMWVVDSLVLNIEDMLMLIADGDLDIDFIANNSSQEIMNTGSSLNLAYKIGNNNLAQLGFTFSIPDNPELNEEVRKGYLAEIVSLAQVARLYGANPDKYSIDPKRESWKITEGPVGLIRHGLLAKESFLEITKHWDGWKDL